MKVKEIKKLLEGLKDEDDIYCVTNDYDELFFELLTAEDLINRANNQAGIDDFEEGVEPINDIDSAIQYLVEFDTDTHIME